MKKRISRSSSSLYRRSYLQMGLELGLAWIGGIEPRVYNRLTHKVLYIHLQSTTVYVPSSELGFSHPLSRQPVCPSPRNQRGGHSRLRVRGWGVPIPTTGEKLSTLPTLCPTQNSRLFESIRFRARGKSRFGIAEVRHDQLQIEMEKNKRHPS